MERFLQSVYPACANLESRSSFRISICLLFDLCCDYKSSSPDISRIYVLREGIYSARHSIGGDMTCTPPSPAAARATMGIQAAQRRGAVAANVAGLRIQGNQRPPPRREVGQTEGVQGDFLIQNHVTNHGKYRCDTGAFRINNGRVQTTCGTNPA